MSTYDDSPALDPSAWRRAWAPVIDALEAAIDQPGLSPADRAALSRIYDEAGSWTGMRSLRPADVVNAQHLSASASAAPEAYEAAREMFAALGLDQQPGVRRGVARDMARRGITSIAALRRVAQDELELLSFKGVGPTTAQIIRAALLEHDSPGSGR